MRRFLGRRVLPRWPLTSFSARLGRGNSLRELSWNRPLWCDGLLVRRVLAGVLFAAAAVVFLRGAPTEESHRVLVAAHDLAPGQVVESGDLRVAHRPAAFLPEGAVQEKTAAVGATVTTAMRAGEMFTDLRVVSPRLATVATGIADARIVPLRLADTAVIDLLRAGDRVDIIAADQPHAVRSAPTARVLATDAVVLLVAEPAKGGPGTVATERLVLVALAAQTATQVAAASLSTALAVVFR